MQKTGFQATVSVVQPRPAGERWLTPRSELELEQWRTQLRSLSGRQLQTLELLATGLHAHEIARRLGVSEATVKTHLQQVYRKLEVTNRVEASTRFLQAGGGLEPPR
jgi:DNA-binding NarL/FixJ family response regulator